MAQEVSGPGFVAPPDDHQRRRRGSHAARGRERTPPWSTRREAAARVDGEHLGPVGGRIVAEVFHGLIDGNPSPYPSQDPDWTPTYGSDDDVGITDLLTAAGALA